MVQRHKRKCDSQHPELWPADCHLDSSRVQRLDFVAGSISWLIVFHQGRAIKKGWYSNNGGNDGKD